MNVRLRPVCDDDVVDLVRLSLSAWAPVFRSFEQILGHNIRQQYPVHGHHHSPGDAHPRHPVGQAEPAL